MAIQIWQEHMNLIHTSKMKNNKHSKVRVMFDSSEWSLYYSRKWTSMIWTVPTYFSWKSTHNISHPKYVNSHLEYATLNDYITTTLNTTTASRIFPHTHLISHPLIKQRNLQSVFFSKVQNSIINRCCGFLAVHYAIPRLHDTSLEQMDWGLQRSVVKKTSMGEKKDPETRDAKIYKWSNWWSEKYLKNK